VGLNSDIAMSYSISLRQGRERDGESLNAKNTPLPENHADYDDG
jgi:hypothetical protein